MIREIARCPYCGQAAGLDDDGPAVVFAPDRARTEACPHLAFLWAALEAYRGRRGDLARYSRRRSAVWLYEHGRGLYRHRGIHDEPISGYILDLVYGFLERDECVTEVKFSIDGGTAQEREEVREGAGYFTLTTATGRNLRAELHGWAVFSPSPEEFAATVRRLITS